MVEVSASLLKTPIFVRIERSVERGRLLDELRLAEEEFLRVDAEFNQIFELEGYDPAERYYTDEWLPACAHLHLLRQRFENRGWFMSDEERDYIDPSKPRRNFNPGIPYETSE